MNDGLSALPTEHESYRRQRRVLRRQSRWNALSQIGLGLLLTWLCLGMPGVISVGS